MGFQPRLRRPNSALKVPLVPLTTEPATTLDPCHRFLTRSLTCLRHKAAKLKYALLLLLIRLIDTPLDVNDQTTLRRIDMAMLKRYHKSTCCLLLR